MKKTLGRSSLSQGVLSVTTKDAGKNISKHGNSAGTSVVESQDDVKNITPRATTPSKFVPVDLPQALTELSLSDAEVFGHADKNVRCTPQKVRYDGSEVLVTEASHDNGVIGGVGVETKTFKAQSPARVICHSPSSYEGVVPGSLVDSNKVPTVSLDGKGEHSITSSKEEPSNAILGETSKAKRKGSARKKKYLPVQSRYKLQSTKDNSLELSVIPPQTNAKPTKSLQKGKRAHSTPYLMNSLYEKQTAPYDGSILDTTAFQARAFEAEKSSKAGKKTASKDNSSDLGKKSKTNDGAPLSQLNLDLHYARNVHMSYVLMKAQETFDKQHEKAKGDIYGLCSANWKLQKEINKLRQGVEMKSLEIAVEQLLRAQVEGLDLIEDKFSNIIVSSSKLSDALTNTAHYLPIKNVIIEEDKLLASLEESKMLLAEVTALTRINQPEIEELAKTAGVLRKTLASELSEQKTCAQLMSTCNSLANHERSLQVQVIQHAN